MDAIKAALQDMLGPQFGVGVTDPADPPDGLWPEEKAAVARAIPKRQSEFAAGRRAARAAMAALNIPPVPIRQGAQRAPVWPKGLYGSISHCAGCCIAAVTHDGTIGIDVEPATPLNSDLIRMICTAPEQAWLTTQPDPCLAAKLIFSAKEAVYKAQYPLTGQVIGFQAVTLDITDMRFTAETPSPSLQFAGSILITHGLVLSTCHV